MSTDPKTTPTKPYTVTTRLNDHTIRVQPIDDPFVTSTTVIGWRDLLRGLFRRRTAVTVLVDADRPTVAAVMNLNRADEQGPNPGVEGVLRANADMRAQLERVRAIVEGRTGEITTVDIVQRVRAAVYAPPRPEGNVLPTGATWTGTPAGDVQQLERAVESWWSVSSERLVQLDRVLELAEEMDHHGVAIQPFVAAQRIRAAVGEVRVDHIPDPPALRLYGDGFSTSNPEKLTSGHLIEAVATERLLTTWYLRCTAPHKTCQAHQGTHIDPPPLADSETTTPVPKGLS